MSVHRGRESLLDRHPVLLEEDGRGSGGEQATQADLLQGNNSQILPRLCIDIRPPESSHPFVLGREDLNTRFKIHVAEAGRCGHQNRLLLHNILVLEAQFQLIL